MAKVKILHIVFTFFTDFLLMVNGLLVKHDAKLEGFGQFPLKDLARFLKGSELFLKDSGFFPLKKKVKCRSMCICKNRCFTLSIYARNVFCCKVRKQILFRQEKCFPPLSTFWKKFCYFYMNSFVINLFINIYRVLWN